MLRFKQAKQRWWNKPLVECHGNVLPAELAVLVSVLATNENGAWMNSRGILTGVVGFQSSARRTIRKRLPERVSKTLKRLYSASGLSKGCPDLVIWSTEDEAIRFGEVKCPHWDQPSAQQSTFLRIAEQLGFSTTIVEWEFSDSFNET